MMIFFPNIPKNIIMEHDILPAHCPIQIEVYLINFVFWLHLDEEVVVVEYGVDEKVRAFFYVVDFSCWGLDEFVLCDSHFAFF